MYVHVFDLAGLGPPGHGPNPTLTMRLSSHRFSKCTITTDVHGQVVKTSRGRGSYATCPLEAKAEVARCGTGGRLTDGRVNKTPDFGEV